MLQRLGSIKAWLGRPLLYSPTSYLALAIMKSHSDSVTLPSADAIKLGLDQQRASPQSSISSVRFAVPSDCTSLTSAFDEGTSSHWATTTFTSSITSKGDTSIMLGSSYANSIPDMARRYRDGWEKASCGSISELPPVHEDTFSVSTIDTSLSIRSISSVLRCTPYPDVRVRRSKSESAELAVAVSRLDLIYIMFLTVDSLLRFPTTARTSNRDV
jgi:hypothetical protein